MKKIFTLVGLLATVVHAVAAVTIYFKPCTNWTTYNAKFSVRAWKSGGVDPTLTLMEAATSADFADCSGWYKAEVDFTDKVDWQFVRVDPDNTTENGIWNSGGNIGSIPTETTMYRDTNTGGDWNYYAKTFANPTICSYTVSFVNDDSWSAVAYHLYGENSVVASWPGTEITSAASGTKTMYNTDYSIYTISFKVTSDINKIIFNDNKAEGFTKTKDLTLTDGAQYTSGYMDFRLIGGVGNDDWSIGDALIYADGVHSVEINNNPDYRFAIVAERWLAADNSYLDGRYEDGTWKTYWDKLIHNVNKQENFADVPTWMDFATYSGSTKIENSGKNWAIQADNDAKITFCYNASNNTWQVTQTDEVTVGDAGWASYSNKSPFAADKAAYVIGSIADGKATLTEVGAGKSFNGSAGVLLNASSVITPTMTVAVSSDGEEKTYSDNYFTGTNKLSGTGNSSTTIGADDLVLGVSGGVTGFYKKKSTDLAAHKAYLPEANVPAGASAISLVFDDEQTGISTVATDRREQTIYSVQGVRRQNMRKGLNIVDGKKVLVR